MLLCKCCVKFNYIEMSFSETSSSKSKSKQPSLEELYTTNDLTLLKKSMAELTAKQDYKTLNTLFRRNLNASKFDTRTLNEDIPQETKRFTKRNGKLCNVSRTVPRKNTVLEQSNTYTFKSRYYDPNTKSFKYIDKPIEPYVNVSRIQTYHQ